MPIRPLFDTGYSPLGGGSRNIFYESPEEKAKKAKAKLVSEAQYKQDATQRGRQLQQERTYRNFLNAFQQAQARATTANVGRYKEIDVGYGDILKMLEGQGGAERTDIEQRSKQGLARAEQDLISRGLSGTTHGTRSTYASALNQDLTRLNESIARMKASIMGQQLSFKERRQDVYPDLSQFFNTARTYAAA